MDVLVFELRRVTTLDDEVTWLGVRSSVYAAAGLIAEERAGEGYRDRFDPYSERVLAIDETTGRPAGCIRLIIKSLGCPLQVESQFGLDVEAASVEISGFAVLPAYRDSVVSLGLIRAVLEIAKGLKSRDIYVEVEPWFLTSLQRQGFPLTGITEPRWFYNAWNVVAHATVGGFYAGVADQWRRGAADLVSSYFSHPYEGRVALDHTRPLPLGVAPAGE